MRFVDIAGRRAARAPVLDRGLEMLGTPHAIATSNPSRKLWTSGMKLC
ncbi:MAG: hypothetical protein JWN20_2288 [Jatrophihabitantaceae bacterium]|nr:hypothetical protein [Jatrophihabitantaceae bacterium]